MVGSLGLFWPPGERTVEIGYSVRVLEKAGFHRWTTEENIARFRLTSPDRRLS
ncbi:hypothetical protein V7793_14265 [Streptomyces sp. KLMMK]|uniref:hypothetical protein n=1 Tax=Streptomyces sp. KLMMK TaxID=3109353 RepID=UPI00300B8F86